MMYSGARTVALCLLLVLAGCGGAPVGTDSEGRMATETATPATPSTAIDAPPSATPKPDGVEVEVIDVVDGDTIDVRYLNGSEDTVRLLGVDTPEVHAETDPAEFPGVPETEAGRNCLREWGERASQHAKDELIGETVTLSFDENEPRRGYYGRLLAYVHVDGDSFNYGLLTRGLARRYDSSNFQYRERYGTAEGIARGTDAGIWGACATDDPQTATETPIPIADGGPPLWISEINADAAGDDRENLNGEYVTFGNAGNETLDLAGWTVRDEAGHVYTFPEGAEIPPNGTITLHTGSGEDGDGAYYWGQGSPVWNNGGDTVIVRNESGETVIEREYDG
ncbi:lamin tail domain-containing protein [Halolamina salina]|uniref:Lamin tail domain-containing protein n=1 Tax=Halolamina salina TaxID=1220023 RepID=A0ABD6B976_9EURY